MPKGKESVLGLLWNFRGDGGDDDVIVEGRGILVALRLVAVVECDRAVRDVAPFEKSVLRTSGDLNIDGSVGI